MIDILKTYNLNVNFSKGIFSSDEKIILIENDNKSVKFIFNFTEDINGQTVLLKIKHYLGKVTEKTISVENNTAEFIFTNDILTAGNLKMSISLIGTDNEILTSSEYLDNIVISEFLGEGEEPSEKEINSLSAAISEVNNLKKVIATAKENGELNGYSTYEIAVKNGFNGTEGEWLKTLIGAEGKGIQNIEFTSTKGLLDTYTVTYTDESTKTFNVKNGNGISNIEELSRENNEVIYRINLLDESFFDFKITEGSNYDDTDIKTEINNQKLMLNGVLKSYDTEIVINDNITVNDCLELPVKDFEIYGKEIKQEIREGYNNLKNFSYDNDSIIDSGITVTLQKSGKILINGTSTKENWFEIMYDLKAGTTMQSEKIVELDSSKTYTLIVKKSGGTNTKNISMSVQKNINTVVEAISITPSSNGNCKIFTDANGLYRAWIFIPSEGTYNNLELEIMVLEGDYTLENTPTYEKYGQSPSVNYPSKLEYVEGNQEIIQTNTNLLGLGEYIEGFTQINIGTFHISSLGKSYLFETSKLPKIITFNAQNANRSNVSYYDDFPNENTQCKEFSTENSTIVPKTVEINKNYKYVLIQLSYQNEISNVQIEEGTNATGYIESKINKFQLTNLPKLYSKDDKIIYLKNEQQGIGWYSYNTYKVRKLLSTDIISKNDYGINSYLINISDIKNSDGTMINVMSNMFEAVKYDDRTFNRNDIIYANTSSKTIVVRNTEFETVEKFKQFLAENDVYIVYRIVTPEYIKITDEILIEQLDKLRTMFLYKGTNNFIVTSENGQPANLEVTAYKDTFKIMQKEIDNLKALVLNTVS